VVNENFNAPGAIFQNETPLLHKPVVPFEELGSAGRLVDLTPVRQYPVGNARRYTPDPFTVVRYCRSKCQYLLIPKLVAACTAACTSKMYAKYEVIINPYFNTVGMARTGAPRYPAGHFYKNEIGRDVRFSYSLKIAGPQPLVGKSWFGGVPDMVVVATAKPYGGHLGDYYDERWPSLGNNWVRFGYTQDPARIIYPTYRARFIPVRTLEKRQLALEDVNVVSDPELFGRYMSVMH
jgi:hypothetical protein